jgi:hypothetical protein
MEKFINKYREQILGTLSGFDRLVFRGSLRRLSFGYWGGLESMVVQGMEQYLCSNHILFKDYLGHVKSVSQKVKQASVKPFENQRLPVKFLRDPAADKEQIARAIAAERKIDKRIGMRTQQYGNQPNVRTSGHAHREPAETLPGDLPIPDPSASGMDVLCMRASRPGSHSTSRSA